MVPLTASALPSFAQQTGAPCATCHTIGFGPALTPFGMQFKLNGYVWGTKYPAVPVDAMVLASYTNTQAGVDGGAAPHFSSNDNLAIDQTSLFYGARVYDKVGAFFQATYDGIAHRASWDNLDVRFADNTAFGSNKLVYGVSLNNSPTVQDLWNSTPAWGYPYQGSGLAPAPTAAPLISGGLAQTVLGLTAYGMLNETFYLEGGAYRMLSPRWQKNVGIDPNADGGESTVKGYAPYWRTALQHKFGPHYASVGAFGLLAQLKPGGDGSQGTDRYTDIGYDATYQFNNGGPHGFNANLTYIHELQKLPASLALGGASLASNQLNTLNLNASYSYEQTYSFSGGPFLIHGGADPTLYAPDAVGGSANGSPNSRGYVTEFDYIPFGKRGALWAPYLNVKVGLQYTYYTQFNGGSANYGDVASGRSAHDNNTTFLFVWFAI
jgi:hypothetical protein